MSIAEKFYRSFYKIKPDVKLTNEQWKVVNMMHECLREYNKPKLPHGKILVEKKQLVNHLRDVKTFLKGMDEVMLDPKNRNFANSEGGIKLGEVWSGMNNSMQSILHFQLNVPLKRLNEEITDELINE